MAWLPTFALRILNDRVNNNIMLIVVHIDMYKWVDSPFDHSKHADASAI